MKVTGVDQLRGVVTVGPGDGVSVTTEVPDGFRAGQTLVAPPERRITEGDADFSDCQCLMHRWRREREAKP